MALSPVDLKEFVEPIYKQLASQASNDVVAYFVEPKLLPIHIEIGLKDFFENPRNIQQNFESEHDYANLYYSFKYDDNTIYEIFVKKKLIEQLDLIIKQLDLIIRNNETSTQKLNKMITKFIADSNQLRIFPEGDRNDFNLYYTNNQFQSLKILCEDIKEKAEGFLNYVKPSQLNPNLMDDIELRKRIGDSQEASDKNAQTWGAWMRRIPVIREIRSYFSDVLEETDVPTF